jgi:hypothetical protein
MELVGLVVVEGTKQAKGKGDGVVKRTDLCVGNAWATLLPVFLGDVDNKDEGVVTSLSTVSTVVCEDNDPFL